LCPERVQFVGLLSFVRTALGKDLVVVQARIEISVLVHQRGVVGFTGDLPLVLGPLFQRPLTAGLVRDWVLIRLVLEGLCERIQRILRINTVYVFIYDRPHFSPISFR
jgi:hypothetical protein